MSLTLKDQVALITGAASGIGQGIALEFAKQGAKLIIVDKNLEHAEKTADDIRSLGTEALPLEADVTDEPAMISAINTGLSHFGKLDILINNAGFQHVSPLESFPTETFEALIKVMLTAPFM